MLLHFRKLTCVLWFMMDFIVFVYFCRHIGLEGFFDNTTKGVSMQFQGDEGKIQLVIGK